jgi:hypothetical protein
MTESLGGAGSEVPPESFLGPRLSRDEDDDLRRLNWLAQNGTLSPLFEERLLERRLRDRRKDIRPPREFDGAEKAPLLPEGP